MEGRIPVPQAVFSGAAADGIMGRLEPVVYSSVAQWQSIRLLTGGL
jgi:hypothetical protein